jgi:hypothetical protein
MLGNPPRSQSSMARLLDADVRITSNSTIMNVTTQSPLSQAGWRGLHAFAIFIALTAVATASYGAQHPSTSDATEVIKATIARDGGGRIRLLNVNKTCETRQLSVIQSFAFHNS